MPTISGYWLATLPGTKVASIITWQPLGPYDTRMTGGRFEAE